MNAKSKVLLFLVVLVLNTIKHSYSMMYSPKRPSHLQKSCLHQITETKTLIVKIKRLIETARDGFIDYKKRIKIADLILEMAKTKCLSPKICANIVTAFSEKKIRNIHTILYKIREEKASIEILLKNDPHLRIHLLRSSQPEKKVLEILEWCDPEIAQQLNNFLSYFDGEQILLEKLLELEI